MSAISYEMNNDIFKNKITMATAWWTDCGRWEYKQRNELGGFFTSPGEKMMEWCQRGQVGHFVWGRLIANKAIGYTEVKLVGEICVKNSQLEVISKYRVWHK